MVSTMPKKLRKALGAVKDQTSISIAKVSNTTAPNLDVLILKATSHVEVPIEDRYVNEILNVVSSNKLYAAACAQSIAKRISRTRNWVVALKTLMLVLRIFQDGDPYFPKEVLHAMKRGAKILNLSSFRDDSNSSPWDFTAFVRTFALYLDERLDCFLTGKLQRRVKCQRERNKNNDYNVNNRITSPVRDMKPAMLLDKIFDWQRLLDRAIGTRPTGATKTNRLVLISLYAVVQESFDLYRDISDGLALLLDSFFHLHYQACASAFQACIKATKQFEEVSVFFDLCKSIGVGRTSEYPSVQKISEEVIETLHEFLKDHGSFSIPNGRPALLLPAPPLKGGSGSGSGSSFYDQSEASEMYTERGSEMGSINTSLEDLLSITESSATSPSMSFDQEYSDFTNANDTTTSNCSSPFEQGTNSGTDVVYSDSDWQLEEENETLGSSGLDLHVPRDGWELVLFETANQEAQPSPSVAINGAEALVVDDLFNQSSLPQNQYNPFLQETIETPTIATTPPENLPNLPVHNEFSVAPTFQIETSKAPTFRAMNSNEAPTFSANNPYEDDPFAVVPSAVANGSIHQQNVLQEQQLWLENQNKIIAKYMA